LDAPPPPTGGRGGLPKRRKNQQKNKKQTRMKGKRNRIKMKGKKALRSMGYGREHCILTRKKVFLIQVYMIMSGVQLEKRDSETEHFFLLQKKGRSRGGKSDWHQGQGLGRYVLY